MSRFTRRNFLKSAAAGAAVFTISGTKASGRVLGANDRIRIAVAGIHGRGTDHMAGYCQLKDQVEIAYLVDPDSRLFESRIKSVETHAGNTPKCVQDLRTVLDDKNLDAVSIAAPNYWHSLLAIWACQAGKDVYVEKPCSHNIFEGRKLVEAARKYNRIVQHGTQSRSADAIRHLMPEIHSGKYGKLLVAYGCASKPRRSIGFKEPKEAPKGFDFDLWLGPAPMQPYHENIVHYNWHWFWDFGNGEIGNQGVHEMDIARWAMPEGATPKRVISLGGRFGYKDQGQTPNSQLTVIDFGDATLIFEDRGLVDNKSMKVADEFYTDQGVIRENMFFPKGQTKGEPIAALGDFRMDSKQDATGIHFANFLDCMRTRKSEDLHAEILEGHLSATLCHLGNISYRLGTDVPLGQTPSTFSDDQTAREAFESLQQHLVEAAGMKLDSSTYRLGRELKFDAQTEKFVDDEEANKLLTRPYRAPYVVPEKV